jgi:hypothetical protein
VVRVVRGEAAEEEVLRARVVSWEMREVRMSYSVCRGGPARICIEGCQGR